MDGYIRVSQVGGREGPSYISPSVQREAIESWAGYKGVEITAWHVDEDWSGGTHERPGLVAAISRAVGGETGGIVAWKIDRFSRFTEGGLKDLRRLENAGARLAFVSEDIDTSGPMGKFVYTIMLAMAEYVLGQIKAGWRTAIERAIERGVKPSRAPIGYERQEDGTVRPSKDAQAIKDAYRYAGTGDIAKAIKVLAAAEPERIWHTNTLRRLLASRTYLGVSFHGDVANLHAHEPLVSPAEWQAAQIGPMFRRRPSDAFPLSGLATCAACGRPMVGGRANRGKRDYRCSATQTLAKRKGSHCDAPAMILADSLENYARDAILVAWDSGDWKREAPDVDLGELQRAFEDAEHELDAFATDQQLRRALGARYAEHLQARVETRDAAKTALRDAAGQLPAEVVNESLGDVLGSADLEELGHVLRGTLDEIVVRKGRGKVEQRVILIQRGGHPLPGVTGAEDGHNGSI